MYRMLVKELLPSRTRAIELGGLMRTSHSFQVGEQVIFRMSKRSVHPGPRAVHVRPELAGEGYQYEVDKFWTVRAVRDKKVVLLTRRGKIRVVDASDLALRRRTPVESIPPANLMVPMTIPLSWAQLAGRQPD